MIYSLFVRTLYRCGFKKSAHQLSLWLWASNTPKRRKAYERFYAKHPDYPKCCTCRGTLVPGYPHHECLEQGGGTPAEQDIAPPSRRWTESEIRKTGLPKRLPLELDYERVS